MRKLFHQLEWRQN